MKKSKKVIRIIIAVALVAGIIVLINYLLQVQKYKKKVQDITFSNFDISKIEDGKYIGESDVDFIFAQVEVIIKEGKIDSINLLKHENERGGNAEQIIDEMVKKQTTEVDAVSGATNSSKVIRKAVENALSVTE